MTYDYGIARVRPARPEDAAALAPRLRSADLQEIKAGSTLEPEKALSGAIAASLRCYTIELADGTVAALFGVARTAEPKLGSVWLLGSDSIKAIRFVFLKHSKDWLEHLFEGFQLLGNFVDARNTVHIEWLRWLGFRFLRRVPLGRNGEEFIEFVRLRE